MPKGSICLAFWNEYLLSRKKVFLRLQKKVFSDFRSYTQGEKVFCVWKSDVWAIITIHFHPSFKISWAAPSLGTTVARQHCGGEGLADQRQLRQHAHTIRSLSALYLYILLSICKELIPEPPPDTKIYKWGWASGRVGKVPFGIPAHCSAWFKSIWIQLPANVHPGGRRWGSKNLGFCLPSVFQVFFVLSCLWLLWTFGAWTKGLEIICLSLLYSTFKYINQNYF